MDPIVTALVNLGGGFTLAGVILLLHREALKAFREEMVSERKRNDDNLVRFWDKLDGLRDSVEEAKCRAPQNYYGSTPPIRSTS